MRVVIIGDGKVGHKLAVELSEEDYDIVLIDQNEGKVRDDLNELDISCITGNGVDAEVLKEADVSHADLVIACASTDELNMLSCLLAKKLGARHTIARVRNRIYYRQIDLLREDLHLSLAVNPDLTAASEISRILLFPEASRVESFMHGRAELAEYTIREGSTLIGFPLSELYKKLQFRMLICAVKRGEEVIIPGGNFTLQAGDKISVAAERQSLQTFFKSVKDRNARIRRVLICGGGNLAFYLTLELLQTGMQVKIIEKSEKRCEELCELLPKATIINGDATDQGLLEEESVENADAFIALTNVDEENIIMALFAKTLGVGKIIAKVDEDSRIQMVEDLGIDSLISVKNSTADAIMSYVMSMSNSYENENVEAVYQLVNGKVEAQEFLIRKDTSYTNIPIKQLHIKEGTLIACIGRGHDVIIPNGDDQIQAGDSVVVICKVSKNGTAIQKFSDIMEK